MNGTTTELAVQIRWLIRRDMPEILEIERSCFEYFWTEEDFVCCLGQRNFIGMVSEHDQKIVGFMIYELHKSKLRIINFAVAPAEQRRGIGRQMIECLKDKLTQQRRVELCFEVRERNLTAQKFFRSQNFQWIRTLKNHYEETGEDAYEMSFLHIENQKQYPNH